MVRYEAVIYEDSAMTNEEYLRMLQGVVDKFTKPQQTLVEASKILTPEDKRFLRCVRISAW
jgi:hypothetical protein